MSDLTQQADLLEAYLAYARTADTDQDAAEDAAQDARDRLLLAIARHLAGEAGLDVRWLVCTSCGMRPSAIENGANWHLGQPATIARDDDVVYVTPHRPDCRALEVEIKRRQAGL